MLSKFLKFRGQPSVISRLLSQGRLTKIVQFRDFATYKTSTGLVGLAVDPESRQTLLTMSAKVLQAIKKMPEDSQYRIDVEKHYSYLTRAATATEDVKAIEDEIGLGQLEEVIEMCKEELDLIDYYYENRGWELVEKAKKEADEIVFRMADSIYFSSPESRPAEAPKPK